MRSEEYNVRRCALLCFLLLLVVSGLSEKALADYCISIAKKTTNANKLISQLQGQGFPATSSTSIFVEELLRRLPQKDGGKSVESQYRQREKQAAKLAKQNEKYDLLLDDDQDAELESLLQQGTKQEERGSHGAKSVTKKRRLRKSRETEDDDEPEIEDAPEVEKIDLEVAEEEERARDQAEKEEFERRLKERDELRTKKLAEAKISKQEMEDIIRRRAAEEAGDREKVVEDLRKLSRREYLKKREEIKLDELERELEDEKYLFEGQELTDKERAELEYKEKVYQLAKERKEQLEELQRDDRYHMPTAYDDATQQDNKSRYDVLTARYHDVDAENEGDTPWAQQEALETEQIKRAVATVGSKDRAQPKADYDFVFEDQIDFIVDSYMKGEILVRCAC